MIDFGTDVSTIPDLDPTFTLISGPQVVAQSIARRLTTPRGDLAFHPDYGIDLRMWLNEAMTPQAIAECSQSIEAECRKDERVETVKVNVEMNYTTFSMRIKVFITTALGPFSLTLRIDKLTAEIIQE